VWYVYKATNSNNSNTNYYKIITEFLQKFADRKTDLTFWVFLIDESFFNTSGNLFQWTVALFKTFYHNFY